MSSIALAQPPTAEARSSLAPGSFDGRRVSEETYWREFYFDSDIRYEWNDGCLEEKPVSDYSTYLVCHWFLLLLSHFLKQRPIAKHVGLEMGFRMRLPGRVVVRRPDLAVVRNDNAQPLLHHDASYHGVFDICLEGLSDLDRRGVERDTLIKKAEYAAAGVPEYYILHGEPDNQCFYRLTDGGVYAPIEPEGGIIRSSVLPGFQFRVSDLVDLRSDEALRDDPVYADFVLPGWRADRERADAETQRADTEAQRAEAEAQRAIAEAQRAQQEAEARGAAETRAHEAEAALAQLREQRRNKDAD